MTDVLSPDARTRCHAPPYSPRHRRSRYDPGGAQRLVHQFTAVRPDGSVRVRNVHLRPMAVAELLAEAGRAGLRLEHVWRSWWREPYAPGDARVVAVFRAP